MTTLTAISFSSLLLPRDALHYVNSACLSFTLVIRVTRSSAVADCTERRVWNVKGASFLLGVGAFRPKFYGNGVISPAKMLIPYFFRYLLWFRSYEAKCVPFGCFHSSMHSNFTETESSHQHSWHQKTRDTGLPDGEDASQHNLKSID